MLKIDNKVLKINGGWLNAARSEPPAPEPLPPYTLRLRFVSGGVTPRFAKGTGVLVDSVNNIWDLTYVNNDWTELLNGQMSLLEVIDGNTTGVTNMSSMFYSCRNLTSVSLFDTSNVTNMSGMLCNCYNLTSVPLFNTSKVTDMQSMLAGCEHITSMPSFDTSNVTNMRYMFNNCYSITSVIPLFNTSKVTNMEYTFYNCTRVQSGALALYQQVSTQTNPPTKHNSTFRKCGEETITGAAELAQIPTTWGGTMQE